VVVMPCLWFLATGRKPAVRAGDHRSTGSETPI
jgi:hypothetical protein